MTRGSVEDTTAYATTNSTGYAESVLGAGIGSNGKVPSLKLSSSCLPYPLSHCHRCRWGTHAATFIPPLSPLSALSALSISIVFIVVIVYIVVLVVIVTPMTIKGGDGELVRPPCWR